MTTNFFHLSLLLLFLDPGSEIRDWGSEMGKNQDPGSGINIPDPQHWLKNFKMSTFTVLVEEPADDSCSVVDPFVINPKIGECFGIFSFYVHYSLCRRMLGSNPGLLRLWL